MGKATSGAAAITDGSSRFTAWSGDTTANGATTGVTVGDGRRSGMASGRGTSGAAVTLGDGWAATGNDGIVAIVTAGDGVASVARTVTAIGVAASPAATGAGVVTDAVHSDVVGVTVGSVVVTSPGSWGCDD